MIETSYETYWGVGRHLRELASGPRKFTLLLVKTDSTSRGLGISAPKCSCGYLCFFGFVEMGVLGLFGYAGPIVCVFIFFCVLGVLCGAGLGE